MNNMGLVDHPLTTLIVGWFKAVSNRAAYRSRENEAAEIVARDRLNAALAATPAVGGRQEALASISRAVYRIREWAKNEGPYSEFIKEAAIIERRIEQIALAQPASPLRGRESILALAAPPEQPAAWHQEPSDDEKIDRAEAALTGAQLCPYCFGLGKIIP